MFDGIEETGIDRFIIALVVHCAFSRPMPSHRKQVVFLSRRVGGVLEAVERGYTSRQGSEGSPEPNEILVDAYVFGLR